MTRYQVDVFGYVVHLTRGTQIVRGTYEVDALYRGEAREMALSMAHAEVEDASLVILDVQVVALG